MNKNKSTTPKRSSGKERIMSFINKKRLVSLFCDLAKIKSPSGYEDEISSFVSQKMAKLGLSVQKDDHGNLIAKLQGIGRPIILCGHLDTVVVGPGTEIKPIIDGDVIRSDGTTVLGADNKGFIAAIIEAISVIAESRLPHRPLEIVFTREEEAISKGAKRLDISLLNGKECLIADDASPLGRITQSAPFNEKFDITFLGKTAHVKNPDRGINAIQVAAQFICEMPLGRVGGFTTVNVAHVLGGLAGVTDKAEASAMQDQLRNTIPDFAKIFGEIRGPKKDEFETLLAMIKRTCKDVAKKTGAKVEFTSARLANGYFHDESDPLVRHVVSVFDSQGTKHSFYHSIGGSDANVLNERGIKTVVISSGEKDTHTVNEQIKIKDLISLTDFIIKFVS